MGLASPLRGLQAGADPAVRAGTNGLFYYSGIAFNRGANAPSSVFVARFIDNDNRENGDATRQQGAITNVVPADSIRFLGQSIVGNGSSTIFLDKPWLAVDVPRGTASCTINFTNPDGSPGTETVPAGIVFVSYSAFDVPTTTTPAAITMITEVIRTMMTSISVPDPKSFLSAPPIAARPSGSR